MLLNGEIFPGTSLGGIALNEEVDSVIKRYSENYRLKNDSGILTFNDDLIVLGYDGGGLVYSVMCGIKYPHKYAGKLWAGMTVAEVIENSTTQVALGGCVVVDGVNGVGLPLPNGLDDFEALTDFLELEYVFANLSVFRL